MIVDMKAGAIAQSVRQRLLACDDIPEVLAALGSIRSSFGPEIVIDPDAPDDLKILAVIVSAPAKVLCTGCKTPAQVVEGLLDDERVAEAIARMVPGLAKAAEVDIGTHIPKAPDPTVSTEGFFEAAPARPGQIPFLCGDLERAGRRVGGSGNAGRAPATRFLRYRIRFGEAAASLAELMAQSALLRDLLVRSGWPQDVIDAAASNIACKMEGPGRIDRVDRASKVLLFPLPGAGYRQISPVQAVPLWYEFRTRILRDGRREGSARRTYALRRRSIGGTKAQNVAVEASDSGGRLELLQSLPPQFKPLPRFERLLHRVRSTGTSLAPSYPPKALVEALRRLASADHVNVSIREAQERAVARLMAIFLEGPLTLFRAVDAGLSIDADTIRDPVERILVLEGFESLDPQGVAELVRRAGGYIAGLAASDADPLRLFIGDPARDLILRGLERAMSAGDEALEENVPQPESDSDDEADPDPPRGKPVKTPRLSKPIREKA